MRTRNRPLTAPFTWFQLIVVSVAREAQTREVKITKKVSN